MTEHTEQPEQGSCEHLTLCEPTLLKLRHIRGQPPVSYADLSEGN